MIIRRNPVGPGIRRLGMVKRAPKKTPLPSAHSDASEDSDSSPNSSADFQMLMSALQGKFAKKAKDQQVRFEGEMKKIVAKTVEALSEKVAAYENGLYHLSSCMRSFMIYLEQPSLARWNKNLLPSQRSGKTRLPSFKASTRA